MATPTVEVTAPAPTIKELEQAMLAAHNAGDENSASILANEIDKLQSASQFKFSATEAAKNFFPSVGREVQSLVGAVTEPIKTAKGLGNLALGVAEKAIPGGTYPQEKYANAVGEYFTNKYGSKDAFLNELQNNPASILSDLSMFVTGGATGASKLASLSKIGAKAVPALEKTAQIGASIDPLNLAANTAGYGITKVLPTTLAPKLYESAAKWSTTLSPQERAAITETALKNQVPLSSAGLAKVQTKIDTLGNNIDTLVSSATDANVKIPATEVFKYINEAKTKLGGPKVEAAKDLAEINKIERDFKSYLSKNKFTSLTPNQLQEFKTNAYKKVNYDTKNQSATMAKEEVYKGMGRAAKESLETRIPEIAALNKQQGELLNLMPNLQRSVGRIENRDIVGIGGPIKITGGAAAGGDVGAGLGLLQSLFEKQKGNLGLNLYKKQNQGVGMFLDNNAKNALLRQALEEQFKLNTQYPGLLSQ